MKENMKIIIEKVNENDYFGYSYNVQVIKDGYYCGIGTYCKSLKEAANFINKFDPLHELEIHEN